MWTVVPNTKELWPRLHLGSRVLRGSTRPLVTSTFIGFQNWWVPRTTAATREARRADHGAIQSQWVRRSTVMFRSVRVTCTRIWTTRKLMEPKRELTECRSLSLHSGTPWTPRCKSHSSEVASSSHSSSFCFSAVRVAAAPKRSHKNPATKTRPMPLFIAPVLHRSSTVLPTLPTIGN